MDFRVKQDKGLHFIYLLPLDNNRLLVESTVFSKFLLDPSWYQNQISSYIDKNLDIKKYEVTDSEQGVLPMFEINSQNKDNYVHIGTKGGATKISSGYAFSFFLKHLTSKDKNYHSYWDKWMEEQTGVTSNLDIKMELWFVNSISSNRIGPFSFDAYVGYQERLVANNTYQGSRFYIGFSTFYQGW